MWQIYSPHTVHKRQTKETIPPKSNSQPVSLLGLQWLKGRPITTKSTPAYQELFAGITGAWANDSNS